MPRPDHVADDDADAVLADREAVVPVAADLQRLDGGPVVGGDLEALVVRRAARQQAPLQDLRDVALLLVQPRVLERERRAVGEIGQERKVCGAEAARAGARRS